MKFIRAFVLPPFLILISPFALYLSISEFGFNIKALKDFLSFMNWLPEEIIRNGFRIE